MKQGEQLAAHTNYSALCSLADRVLGTLFQCRLPARLARILAPAWGENVPKTWKIKNCGMRHIAWIETVFKLSLCQCWGASIRVSDVFLGLWCSDTGKKCFSPWMTQTTSVSSYSAPSGFLWRNAVRVQWYQTVDQREKSFCGIFLQTALSVQMLFSG